MKNNAPGIHENEMQGRSCGDMGIRWNRLSEFTSLERQTLARGLDEDDRESEKLILVATLRPREPSHLLLCSNRFPR